MDDPVVCIGCGCDDMHACAGGCEWVAVDPDAGLGICSVCAEKPLSELVPQAASLGLELAASGDFFARCAMKIAEGPLILD